MVDMRSQNKGLLAALRGRAGSRPRQVRPRPKAPPKKKNSLGKKGPTFHS